jgi:transcriptional regulator with XRE-family HTH domain
MTSSGPLPAGRLTLGQWLRYWRLKAGVRQEDVAEAIGYSRASVNKAEKHGAGDRNLFALAGAWLGAGDELGRMHDLIGSRPGMVVVVPRLERAHMDDMQVSLLLLPEPPPMDDPELPSARSM